MEDDAILQFDILKRSRIFSMYFVCVSRISFFAAFFAKFQNRTIPELLECPLCQSYDLFSF